MDRAWIRRQGKEGSVPVEDQTSKRGGGLGRHGTKGPVYSPISKHRGVVARPHRWDQARSQGRGDKTGPEHTNLGRRDSMKIGPDLGEPQRGDVGFLCTQRIWIDTQSTTHRRQRTVGGPMDQERATGREERVQETVHQPTGARTSWKKD